VHIVPTGSATPADEGGGRVVLVGAPLGNPADASPRLREVLAAADVIAAEDTRRLLRLARDTGVEITAKVVSYFEGNEARRTPDLVAAAQAGACVAVVTDGGMPSVSDPGFRLVRAAIEAGLPVTAAPGPSAVTTALALSGLPSHRFCFEGFLPRRAAERRARLAGLATEERTLVFFEAPHRIAETLTDLAATFGAGRPAALCRELTKTYEEVRRGSLGELAEAAGSGEFRGEITVVVAGAPPVAPPDLDDAGLAAAVAAEQSGGLGRTEAVVAVARRHGLHRRDVYDAVLRHRSGGSPSSACCAPLR
jgi:16S rRNA (cytidine1402-2'-O)-methyltransferase